METFDNFLLKLLTKKELKLLQKRYAIIRLLQTNLTYREIARQMKISTTTVVRLNQRLKVRKKISKKLIKNKPSFKDKYIRLSPRSYPKTNIFNKKESIPKRIPWIIG